MLLNISIVKNLGGAGSRNEWDNTYLMETNDDLGVLSPSVDVVVNGLIAAEKSIHTNKVFIARVVVSTTIKGDKGPLKNRSIPVGQYGSIATGALQDGEGEMLPLEMVLEVNFGGESGAAGKKFYRGALRVWDVDFVNGTVVPSSPADGGQRIAAVANFFQGAWIEDLRIKSVVNGNTTGRVFTNVTFGGINFRQLDRVNKKKSAKTEQSLTNLVDDFIQTAYTITQAIAVLSAAGKLTQAAALVAKLVQAKAIVGAIQPPALPQGQ